MLYNQKIAQEIIEKQKKGRTLLREDIAGAIQDAMDKQATACMKAGVFFATDALGWKGNEDLLIRLQDVIHTAKIESEAA